MVDTEKDEVLQANNDVYKCPSCGSNLSFDPESQGLKCAYCGYELKLKGQGSGLENDIDFAPKNNWSKEAHDATCPNCSAHVIIDPDMLSAKCPFCDTPMVISEKDIIGYKPDRVIPFQISEATAKDCYRKWIKKKAYAARKVKKEIPSPSMHSIYIPSWTYDTNAFATYEGRLGKKVTTTVGSGSNARTVTKIKYFKVEGVIQLDVDDLLICSGKQITQKELDKLEPFDTNNSYVYDNRYLSGHSTEHYDLDLHDGWDRAKKYIYTSLKEKILDRYDYDEIDYLNINPTYAHVRYKYVILPTWICHFPYGRKKYRFIVNGETGRVIGKFPISPIKVSFTVIGIILAIAVFILLCSL